MIKKVQTTDQKNDQTIKKHDHTLMKNDGGRNTKQNRMNMTPQKKLKKLVQTLGQEQFLQEIWGLTKKMGFLSHPQGVFENYSILDIKGID